MPEQLVKTYLPLEDFECERDRAERYRVALERIASGWQLPNGGHCSKGEMIVAGVEALKEFIEIAQAALEGGE